MKRGLTLRSIAQFSEAEETLLWQLRHLAPSGTPIPEREFRFARATQGREWRFDFAWPEDLVAVEVEGLTFEGGRHQRKAGFAEDLAKYNAAALEGWLVLRFTSRMVKQGTALEATLRALNQRRERARA